jgi:mitotic-spindle organizing protein 1
MLRDQVDILYQMSLLLNCNLDKETVAICMELIEIGLNPEGLVACLKEIRN